MISKCQLAAISRDFARVLTPGERILHRWRKIRRRLNQILPKLFSPTAVARKTGVVLHLTQLRPAPTMAVRPADPMPTPVKLPPLGLQPEEPVRVKSFEEIQRTLDVNGCYEGCAFMFIMREFCGKTFKVAKRIDHFFDERDRKLLRARNMVILHGVHCHSEPDHAQAWAGCERSCYLFWKEAWLQRVEAEVAIEDEPASHRAA